MNRKLYVGTIAFIIAASGVFIGLTGCSQRRDDARKLSPAELEELDRMSADKMRLSQRIPLSGDVPNLEGVAYPTKWCQLTAQRSESDVLIKGQDIYISADEVWVICRPEGGLFGMRIRRVAGRCGFGRRARRASLICR